MSTNPLLDAIDPFPFDTLEPEHLLPAIEQLVVEHQAALQVILRSQQHMPTWDDLVAAVDGLDARLNDRVNGIVLFSTLGPRWKEAVGACYGLKQRHQLATLQNRELYQLYVRLAESEHGQGLEEERRVTLANLIDDFRLAGIDLPDDKRARLAEVLDEIAALEGEFAENVQRASHRGIAVSDPARLAGLPALCKAQLAQRAGEQGKDGWLIPLEQACVQNILDFAEDRSLREAVYRAYATRASELDGGPDNAPVLQRLAALRHEHAALLGYPQFVELGVQRRTATSTAQVATFLEQLAGSARPALAREREVLQEQASRAGVEALQPWDVGFFVKRAGASTTVPDEDHLRGCFALEPMLAALMRLASMLFDLRFVPVPGVPVWHPEVQAFEVHQDNAVLGHLYLDLLAREGKDDYAWSLRLSNRHVDADGAFHKGASALVISVPRPVEGKPALLSHLDLRKLYHEMGHCLHNLLVRSSGYRAAELGRMGSDGLEVPAELLERWVWSTDYLAEVARHYHTGARLPRQTLHRWLEQLRQAERIKLGEELTLALFDLQLHSSEVVPESVLEVYQYAAGRVVPGVLGDFERPANTFDHLVSGYSGGYYGYLWSKVQAFDAFTRFADEGLLDHETGKAFEQDVFVPAVLRTMTSSIENFLGRDISQNAFLTWYGMQETPIDEKR